MAIALTRREARGVAAGLQASVRIARCLDFGLWDAFVVASPHGSVFSHTAFLDSLGVDYELWWVDRDDGRPYLGAVLLKGDDGQPRRAPFSFSLYHGLLFSDHHAELPTHTRVHNGLRFVECLLNGLEARYGQISFCLHPDFEDLRGLSWFHYHQPERGRFNIEAYYTGRIELNRTSGLDEYLASVRRVRRYEYRRAQGHFEALLTNDVETLVRLNLETLARQGVALNSDVQRRLCSIATSAVTKGFGEIIEARNRDGHATSAALFLYDKRCGYYLVGANDPAFRGSGSGTFVVVEGIRRCFARGVAHVDVCGMNSPNRGDFKASLNAVPVPYFVATWKGHRAEGTG